ncbi:MAG: Enoyl-CoA hydratase/isomerase [Hydrocarboniphaga sp.]|uniref:enoyl-CoA hydratase/isomerase family protein n=1 Tax=Hydrocarboniphaga sp. TaxID=2033016 RepID=UPI002603928B|nr:enoyl-CoA hydratase/isomerase family protein [Hydrocarboniphaga sp.]MDB5967730.1 Enoyl-CoA hydratase/isomerase [Hydrocarboniphaga sp.]
MSEPVVVERRDHLAIVTMNLPRRRNALVPELYLALARTLAELQDEPKLLVLVLSGGKHFCAGGDLGGLDDPALSMRRAMQMGSRIVRTLISGRLPVVAAVEGNAYGAGFSIAMACDFVVVDEASTFCASFGRVGLQPDYGLMWTLPQRVGIGMAREILMFCEPIRGEQAKELKLADRLAPVGTVLDTAVALARRLAQLAPSTLATTKAILSRSPMSLDTMLAWEADTQSLLLHSEDFAEGVKAFGERRDPHFTGR